MAKKHYKVVALCSDGSSPSVELDSDVLFDQGFSGAYVDALCKLDVSSLARTEGGQITVVCSHAGRVRGDEVLSVAIVGESTFAGGKFIRRYEP